MAAAIGGETDGDLLRVHMAQHLRRCAKRLVTVASVADKVIAKFEREPVESCGIRTHRESMEYLHSDAIAEVHLRGYK